MKRFVAVALAFCTLAIAQDKKDDKADAKQAKK